MIQSGKRFAGRPSDFLDGRVLLAMPGIGDTRFERTVIYVCAHSGEGAMGLVVNKPARKPSFADLLVQLDIVGEKEAIRRPAQAGATPVLKGGPVETGRGFVLHSGDFHADNSTLTVTGGVCLTATVDILRAIARGEGPDRALLALGYARWSPGQLEEEIKANVWLPGEVDEALVFDRDLDAKYERAMRGIGVDPARLSAQAGRA